MRLVWAVIPLVLIISMMGIWDIDAEIFTSDMYNAKDLKVSFSTEPKISDLTLDTFDNVNLQFEFFNATMHPLEHVTYRIEISYQGVLLARNLVYSENNTSIIQISPVSECDELELWKCTDYHGSEHVTAPGALYSYGENNIVIIGPTFSQVGLYDISIQIIGINSSRTELTNPQTFNFPVNISQENVLLKETKKITYSPKKQLESGITPEDIICKEGLQLIFKLSDNSPACVTLETAEKLIQRGWGTNTNDIYLYKFTEITCTTKFEQEKKTYFVKHNINNAKINNLDKIDAYTLILSISPVNEGTLHIEIPRGLLDSKWGHNLQDSDLFVLQNGIEIEFTELKRTDESRLLEINFDHTANQIEIIGSYPLPILDEHNSCD